MGSIFLIVLLFQIDYAVVTERGSGGAGLGIERYEPVAGRDIEDSLIFAVGPVGQSTAGELPGCGRATRAFVLTMRPEELTGGGVERYYRSPRTNGGIDHAIDHQRCGFELKLRARAKVVGLEAPGDLELVEVVRVDLIERSVTPVAEIAP